MVDEIPIYRQRVGNRLAVATTVVCGSIFLVAFERPRYSTENCINSPRPGWREPRVAEFAGSFNSELHGTSIVCASVLQMTNSRGATVQRKIDSSGKRASEVTAQFASQTKPWREPR